MGPREHKGPQNTMGPRPEGARRSLVGLGATIGLVNLKGPRDPTGAWVLQWIWEPQWVPGEHRGLGNTREPGDVKGGLGTTKGAREPQSGPGNHNGGPGTTKAAGGYNGVQGP